MTATSNKSVSERYRQTGIEITDKIRDTKPRIWLAFSILLAGVAVMMTMAFFKHTPEKVVPTYSGVSVETLKLSPVQRSILVKATGTVQPCRQVDIIPQVSGHVVHLAPGFVAGGFFKAGETLFRIDDHDYRLAAVQSRARVVRADYEMVQMESQARIAREEWKRSAMGEQQEPSELVLYKPQLKNAQAVLASAKAELEKRLLDIERTVIKAPFDCLIQSEAADLGQFIAAGSAVARIVGTRAAEIVVPVSLDDLIWLEIPKPVDGKTACSPAAVQLSVAGQTHSWTGCIDRTLGSVDPQGRMTRLVVKIEDPYNQYGSPKRPPIDLAIGLFVDVTLKGKTIPNVYSVPVDALREHQTVWILDDDSKLEVRPVRVFYRQKDLVLIDQGLHPDDRVVLTQVAGAAPQMKLKNLNEGTDQ